MLPTGARAFIVAVIIIFALLVKLILYRWIRTRLNDKQAERQARGCTCFNNADYYCLPWPKDSECTCGALQPGGSKYPVYNPTDFQRETACEHRQDLEMGTMPPGMPPAYEAVKLAHAGVASRGDLES